MDGSSLRAMVDSPIPEYWRGCGPFNMIHYCTAEQMWYKTPNQEKLLKACMEHARENERGVSREDAVIVVHPYFSELCGEIEKKNGPGPKRYAEYRSKLETLLAFADRSRFDVILFDVPEHYALKTHELAEEGVFDGILFTKFGFGRIIDCGAHPTGLRKKLKNIMRAGCAGSYVGGVRSGCLSEVVVEIRPNALIYPIMDALLPSRDEDGLIEAFFNDISTPQEDFRWAEDMIVPAAEL